MFSLSSPVEFKRFRQLNSERADRRARNAFLLPLKASLAANGDGEVEPVVFLAWKEAVLGIHGSAFFRARGLVGDFSAAALSLAFV